MSKNYLMTWEDYHKGFKKIQTQTCTYVFLIEGNAPQFQQCNIKKRLSAKHGLLLAVQL